MALKVFVDFDGAIGSGNLSAAFFRRFGGAEGETCAASYESGGITVQEFLRRGTDAVGTPDPAPVEEFLRRWETEESFGAFVEFCRARGVSFTVVSDGLDSVIRKVFADRAFGDVALFANCWEYAPGVDGRRVSGVQFPYANAECCRCACCIRNIMLTHAGEEDVIAYVGGGCSDPCPVPYADIVFARDALQSFCQRENISHYLYSSFDDVIERLRDLLGRKRLRRRWRAELKRREAFLAE